MAKVLKRGRMALAMWVNGKTIRHADTVSSLTQKVTLMKDSGQMIKPMVTEYISTLMEPNTRAIGKTIYNMDLEQKLGQTNLNMKANIALGENMDQAPTNGVMVQHILANGWKIRSSEQAFIHGQMEEATSANGKKTIWKAQESINGAMEDPTKVNMQMTKNTVMVYIDGLMEEPMPVIGIQVNNMVWVFTLQQPKIERSMGSGKRVKELNGLVKIVKLKSITMKSTTYSTLNQIQAKILLTETKLSKSLIATTQT